MRGMLTVILSFAVTIVCWGIYGPVLHWGQADMSTLEGHYARLRPFVCVGLAYFAIGVVVPTVWLWLRGESGGWTLRGILWSLAGGALGALGALGIILAFTFGGKPITVMPLVFGGAPVVNAFLTITMARRMREIGPLFMAGLIIVALGAVTVLIFAPGESAGKAAGEAASAAAEAASPNILDWLWRMLSITTVILCWGAYGPVLHKGQAAMENSRLRPLLCVGLAYFAIAVIVPNLLLTAMPEPSSYGQLRGTLWSLAAGAAGAMGAIGIILAFNFGGKPIYVMPLVFGGAPVVNTFFSMSTRGQLGEVDPLFLAGLILVIAGAAMVLIFAPKGEPNVKKPRLST